MRYTHSCHAGPALANLYQDKHISLSQRAQMDSSSQCHLRWLCSPLEVSITNLLNSTGRRAISRPVFFRLHEEIFARQVLVETGDLFAISIV